MMFSSQDSSSERDRIKQEHYTVYATPSVPSAGVATQVVQYPESQIPALELRTASSINTTASSGAFGSSSGEMPQKRSSPGQVNGSPAKHVKAEHPEEFSQAVKKKLLNSTRTGQACDRCKVRPKLQVGSTRANMLPACRFERSDAMDSPEDAPLACRTITNVVQQTELRVAQHPEDTSRGWNNKLVICNTGSRIGATADTVGSGYQAFR